jgi:RNA-directed DNA polymerase
MRQRPGANTQGSSRKVAWPGLPWTQVHRQVCRLQQRMYRAAQRGEVRVVHTLQKLLVKSWSARRLAVRRIPQDTRGRPTAGIAGVKSFTPPRRWRVANERGLDGPARSLRRLWIPTRGATTDNRPLGMPPQADRARHTLVRQALEPAGAAKFSAHPYGFRPGRSGHEALGALCTTMRYRPQFARTIAIAQGVDTIDPQAVWATVPAPPRLRRPRNAWRQAGLLEEEHLRPTPAGTPQGGSGSPLLALIARHGREAAIPQVSPHARGIAYADEGGV